MGFSLGLCDRSFFSEPSCGGGVTCPRGDRLSVQQPAATASRSTAGKLGQLGQALLNLYEGSEEMEKHYCESDYIFLL